MVKKQTFSLLLAKKSKKTQVLGCVIHVIPFCSSFAHFRCPVFRDRKEPGFLFEGPQERPTFMSMSLATTATCAQQPVRLLNLQIVIYTQINYPHLIKK